LQGSERGHNYDVKFPAFKNVVYPTYVKVEEEEEEEEEEVDPSTTPGDAHLKRAMNWYALHS
jgi:hypothetical protein